MKDTSAVTPEKGIEGSRRWWRTIYGRIALLVTLATLPLGLISVYQTRAVIEEARAVSNASLLAQTVAAAASERQLIEMGLGAAKGLASALPAMSAAQCEEVLRGFVAASTEVVFAGYLNADGMMTCSSTGDQADFSGSESFERARANPRERVEVNEAGRISGQHVVILSHPSYVGGVLAGFVSLSIPYATVSYALNEASDAELASLTVDGNVISASGPKEEAESHLPRDIDIERLRLRSGTTFRAISRAGEERVYAVESTIEGTSFLVGSWPIGALPAEQSNLQGMVAMTFPLLMWFAGVIVALFGMRRLVIRHIADLRSAMRRFALGTREPKPLRLKNAPVELADAERAFNRMALLLTDAEARQVQDLKDKEVLLREIHHRVKNNLQLIASIINMQARKVETEDARHVLSRLQQRVRGLAVLHRTLFNTADTSTIDARELVQAVVDDIRLADPNTMLNYAVSVEPLELYPDQAVPLSMLVAEILMAIRDAKPQSEGDAALIDFHKRSDEAYTLRISSPLSAGQESPLEAASQLGRQLIQAFMRQLDGVLDEGTDDLEAFVTVTIPKSSLLQ